MATMRAAQYDRFGPPEVLHVAEVPQPPVKPGYIKVRVQAASLNGGELMARSGRIRLLTGRRFPKATGVDFVGEIEVAPTGGSLKVGDRVWGCLPDDQYVRGRFGALAEYVALPPNRVSLAPMNLTPVECATLTVGITALQALRDKGKVKSGDRVLVRGASGGVGTTAVQIAKHLGAHVTAISSPRNIEHVRALGADEVHNYKTTKVGDLGPFDVVIDCFGSELSALRRIVAPGGRMVAIAMDPDHLIRSALAVGTSFLFGRRRIRFFRASPTPESLSDMARLADAGAIEPVIQQVYTLDDIATAHTDLESGGTFGKRVFAIS
jgi:NADPH:quinone reductase-like Zn-dependent oxidoreductase